MPRRRQGDDDQTVKLKVPKRDLQLRFAIELLSTRGGERPFRLCTRIMQGLGVSRRTADRILARAREAIAKANAEAVRDLSASIIFKFVDALEAAKTDGDHRAVTRLLAEMRKLAESADAGTATAGGKYRRFSFYPVEPEPQSIAIHSHPQEDGPVDGCEGCIEAGLVPKPSGRVSRPGTEADGRDNGDSGNESRNGDR